MRRRFCSVAMIRLVVAMIGLGRVQRYRLHRPGAALAPKPSRKQTLSQFSNARRDTDRASAPRSGPSPRWLPGDAFRPALFVAGPAPTRPSPVDVFLILDHLFDGARVGVRQRNGSRRSQIGLVVLVLAVGVAIRVRKVHIVVFTLLLFLLLLLFLGGIFALAFALVRILGDGPLVQGSVAVTVLAAIRSLDIHVHGAGALASF